jgi:uncharacterized protein YxjI
MIEGFGGAIDPSQMGCGGRHESQLEGYTDEIKSKDINSFDYGGTKAGLYAAKKDGKVLVTATGGGDTRRREGKYFRIKLETDDYSIFNDLQEVVDKYEISRGNGYCVHVDGLPSGIGDRVHIEYESGEKIYKVSNQSLTISFDAADAIYDTFLKYVRKHGCDFTSAGSNQQLYDDADMEYVQGTWKGTHFGREVVATFDKDHITITIDGKVTDDNVPFIIFDGCVTSSNLQEGKTEAYDENDYDYLNGVSHFRKKNWFTMTAYFMQDSYSTCDMHNFDKKKPEDEE